ncbi:MAG: hypothetical protein IJE07_05610 [Clostridia bacterium]|nr:hypothetical protein [Clostridia bacterium]
MKRIPLILLLLTLFLALPAHAATVVPLSTGEIPAIPAAPQAPQVVRAVHSGAEVAVTFDRDLPREMLLSFVALDGEGREVSVRYAQVGREFTAESLPSGGQWLRIELAWVEGGVNATARFNMGGGLMQLTRFDGSYNEFVYGADGVFTEFRDEKSGVWTRFDASGNATVYSYEAQGMRVWFDLAGNVCWATYSDGSYALTWEPGEGWFIEAPAGNIPVRLDLDPTRVSPLLIIAEPSPTPEVVWYPNNTITLAGLSLQEADSRLPDKWYNVIPVDLTRQGRQTYFLVISNARFIGECYVDVWGDEVVVTCEVISRSGIELKSEYGRWFTRLSQVTSSSIESTADGFRFGEPVSISRDLGGADVALLFIRSKATYRQPFRDGTELTRYWRNTPAWKQFREDLTQLMPLVEH